VPQGISLRARFPSVSARSALNQLLCDRVFRQSNRRFLSGQGANSQERSVFCSFPAIRTKRAKVGPPLFFKDVCLDDSGIGQPVSIYYSRASPARISGAWVFRRPARPAAPQGGWVCPINRVGAHGSCRRGFINGPGRAFGAVLKPRRFCGMVAMPALCSGRVSLIVC